MTGDSLWRRRDTTILLSRETLCSSGVTLDEIKLLTLAIQMPPALQSNSVRSPSPALPREPTRPSVAV